MTRIVCATLFSLVLLGACNQKPYDPMAAMSEAIEAQNAAIREHGPDSPEAKAAQQRLCEVMAAAETKHYEHEADFGKQPATPAECR